MEYTRAVVTLSKYRHAQACKSRHVRKRNKQKGPMFMDPASFRDD